MKKIRKQREPSRASLREMPEVDLKDGRWRPNPYAARIAAEGVILPGRGRPKKGALRAGSATVTGPTCLVALGPLLRCRAAARVPPRTFSEPQRRRATFPRRRYIHAVTARAKDPRPTLTAYGAPLFFLAKRDMTLEEAVVRSLRILRRDPTVLLSLPLVLVRNERALDKELLLAKARSLGLETELGMMLDLTGEVARLRRFQTLARRLGAPRARLLYLTNARSSFARRAADESTPPVVARWGFRMNMPESSFRQFLAKHNG